MGRNHWITLPTGLSAVTAFVNVDVSSEDRNGNQLIKLWHFKNSNVKHLPETLIVVAVLVYQVMCLYSLRLMALSLVSI